jgi:ribosomal-protein-alanine N-acetyltransferase
MAKSHDIRTKRLVISPFEGVHLNDKYVEWLNDPEVVRFSEQRHLKHTLESCRAYWRSFSESPNYFWAIEEVEKTMGHIGNMNAYVNQNNSVADVGILIGEKKAWNKGYGFEAFSAVCRFLLRELGLRKVSAGTMALNLPMLRIMERLGMKEDGCRERHYLFNGKEVDLIHMALFKD